MNAERKTSKKLSQNCLPPSLVTRVQRMADDDSLFSLAALLIPAQVQSLQHSKSKLEKKDVENILLRHATLEYFVRSGVQASRALTPRLHRIVPQDAGHGKTTKSKILII